MSIIDESILDEVERKNAGFNGVEVATGMGGGPILWFWNGDGAYIIVADIGAGNGEGADVDSIGDQPKMEMNPG
jgi:hypothetical protein